MDHWQKKQMPSLGSDPVKGIILEMAVTSPDITCMRMSFCPRQLFHESETSPNG